MGSGCPIQSYCKFVARVRQGLRCVSLSGSGACKGKGAKSGMMDSWGCGGPPKGGCGAAQLSGCCHGAVLSQLARDQLLFLPILASTTVRMKLNLYD